MSFCSADPDEIPPYPSIPEDLRLASRSLPSGDKRWARGTDFCGILSRFSLYLHVSRVNRVKES